MVVDVLADPLDAVFHALADPTRRDIVRRTVAAESSVSGLARAYPISFAAVQKHVAVLEQAGLVTKRRHGLEQLVSARGDSLHAAGVAPDQLERWWGPPTYPATVVEHDLTPGGHVTYFMTGPEGERFHGWCRVLEVDPPLSLIHISEP